MTDRQLGAINRFEGSDAFSALEKLVLRYTTLMTQCRVVVTAALVTDLCDYLSEPQIVELTSAIA